ncbi:hypothetical protein KSC_026610 [Ktedonobacter sp. SOSP1-52]|uniref:histidine kinase dimerization/phospho-acceptor domain-containing protein n=1 Tax=Ktedonobacter sp. SOSP1-52 TaxID=2778366 RepID=UPI0019162B85|nr:histidine kinase dimerization/phospho-acceptor domain-containing protein [Ktedonobacter sp. SOSP1-52]GHO63769.1 hypothetical protein KSC_026610 [Ktedonobacter sp. SOSP1-52]
MARHELKTLLTIIKGSAQLLKRQLKKLGLEEQARTLAKREEQTGILTKLMNELIDVTRIQAREEKLFTVVPGTLNVIVPLEIPLGAFS